MIAVIGSSDLTREVLRLLLESGPEVSAIVTGSETFTISYDRTGVRNARYADLRPIAEKNGIPCHVYDGDAVSMNTFLAQQNAKIALVAGWYHIVAGSTRALFPKGCIGLHASLLPRLRGGAPLNWALLAGDSETGVSLFELGSAMDEGPIYGQERFSILPGDYISALVERCEAASLRLIRRCLPEIMEGRLSPKPQQGNPTYGLQRRPSDSAIDWRQSASQLELLVRASSRPYVGAFTHMEGVRISIWRARAVLRHEMPVVFGQPGQVACLSGRERPLVLCSDGALELEELSDANGVDLTEECKRWGHRRFDSYRI